VAHVSSDRKKLLARVRRIQGQLNALHQVLETRDDCREVLHLLASCRGSINGLMNEVLEGHIRFHLMGGEPEQAAKQAEAAEELIEVLRKYLT
jgi:DNA-binding FrmR family transcriptional regulator